ncbi:hypothetical protein [Adlercreutzia sp. ZJ138]|uniref:hypothetical protein n=1 Tax=Adlercreutzia sp. ZJ138 TaxID=2709405 RepID=UPI0013ECFA37|nr:hypothetical protein [Adlercreutzia sp. ZJ138]
MTQSSPGFSFITVHDDEDDVVIQAGIREPREDEWVEDASAANELAGENGVDGASGSDDVVDGTNDSAEADTDVDIVVADVADADTDADELVVETDGEQQDARLGTDQSLDGGRYVTTAADLESTPMPIAQKVTIIAGVILCAIAIIYCALCR